jgi:hypothetical protein
MRAPLRCLSLVVLAFTAVPSATHGHVLDEYVQSTLVAIEPGDIRLKINLTPGIEIAERVLNEIDRNGDGVVSRDESASYAEMLRQDLIVRLDGREIPLMVTASNIPPLDELRSGDGIIQMEFSVHPITFGGGTHQLTLENRHFSSLGVYLLNAARPQSTLIRIAKQHRNANQSRGEIEFTYEAVRPISVAVAGLFACVALALVTTLAALCRFRKVGLKA